jgi:hypothetical protein
MSVEEQRMLWLAGSAFGDEGNKFRLQTRQSLRKAWKLGIEHHNGPTFASVYAEWAFRPGQFDRELRPRSH